MSSFYFALVTSAIVTVILVVSKSSENKENTTAYAIKVFVSTFIASFLTFTYMGGNITSGGSSFGQEIDVGEPPF